MASYSGFLLVGFLLVVAVVVGIVIYYATIKPKSEGCKTNDDCTSKLCNQTTGICGCNSNSDCSSGEICSSGGCIKLTPCAGSGATATCPDGQVCNTVTGYCQSDVNYIQNIIGQKNDNCPAGTQLMKSIAPANGNLKQGTGNNTPNIYWCIQYGSSAQGGITDLLVAKFQPTPTSMGGVVNFITNPVPCPQLSGKTSSGANYIGDITYGDLNEDNYSSGCGGAFSDAPYTKICYGNQSSRILTDVVVVQGTTDDPNVCAQGGLQGYFPIATYTDDDIYTDQTANLNQDCGGTINLLLCGRY